VVQLSSADQVPWSDCFYSFGDWFADRSLLSKLRALLEDILCKYQVLIARFIGNMRTLLPCYRRHVVTLV